MPDDPQHSNFALARRYRERSGRSNSGKMNPESVAKPSIGLMELPIACTLSPAEQQERRRALLDSVRRATIEVTELPLGYAYRFDPTRDVLFALSRLIDLERKCCPFLTFTLIVEAGQQSIRLEITGAPAAKSVIADFFGS